MLLLLSALVLPLTVALSQTMEHAKPELYVQSAHTSSVCGSALSPDGRWLVTGGRDKTLKLWDVATGLQLRTLAGHAMDVISVAISPDGRLIASASQDQTVRLWDVASGRTLRTLEFHPVKEEVSRIYIESVDFSPDGRIVAAATDDGTIVLWEVASGLEIRRMGGPNPDIFVDSLNSIGFSPDGLLIACGSKIGLARIWDVRTGRPVRTFEGLPKRVTVVAFSPKGTYLAVGAGLGPTVEMRVWRVDNWELIHTFRMPTTVEPAGVDVLAFSPDEHFLASGTRGVKVWELASGREREGFKGHEGGLSPLPIMASWKGHEGGLSGLAFAADGTWLVSSTSPGPNFVIWDMATGRQIREISTLPFYPVIFFRFSPDMRSLMAFSPHSTNKVKVWDFSVGSVTRGLVPRELEGVYAISQDGRWIVTSRDNNVLLYEISTGREVLSWKTPDKLSLALAISPDSRWLARGSDDNTIQLWDLATGRESLTFKGHTDDVKELTFSPDGRLLASGAFDSTVKIWDVARGRQLRSFKYENSLNGGVAFSLDGRWLAVTTSEVGKENVVSLWDVESGSRRQQMEIDPTSWGPVAFSPDGRRLVSGDGSSLKIWEIPTGRRIQELTGHSGDTFAIGFSADGRILASSADDGSVRLWDATSGQPLATLVSLPDTLDWLVSTPDGLFDGTAATWNQVLWRFNNNTFDVAPVEVFFNEFYHPGLLTEILAGKRPKAPRDIGQLDRRQPEVKLTLADGQAEAGGVSARTVRVRIEVREVPPDAQHPMGGGARDLRLFRNGSLVKVWRGGLLGDRSGPVTLEATLPIVAGENRLTAYAFNRDNVKSRDAELVLKGADTLKHKGTAWVLAIGVNRYANQDFNLKYAAADAQVFAEEMARQQSALGTFEKVEVTPLLDQDATKANILRALARLAGQETGALPHGTPAALAKLQPSQPEDAVLVYYAGHGTAAGPRFYLIPHDLGYTGARTEIDEAGLKTILDHSISDIELEQAFEKVDAGRLLLVIDACNSGQALEAEEKRRGPMNSKGLAQLAYEKGMNVLTAAQGYQAALEVAQLGHGLMTYALVEEGLKTPAADTAPKDGQVVMREWLDYATLRVPQLQEGAMQAARKVGREVAFVEGEQLIKELEKRNLQRPRVFYRREPESEPLIVAKPQANP